MFVDFSTLTKLWKMKHLFIRLAITVNTEDNVQEALKRFKDEKSHIAVVKTVIDDGKRDRFYGVAGIVTL